MNEDIKWNFIGAGILVLFVALLFAMVFLSTLYTEIVSVVFVCVWVVGMFYMLSPAIGNEMKRFIQRNFGDKQND